MDLGLKDARCVVTGGSRGIGLASAEVLLAEGATVLIAARRRASVDPALASLASGGPVLGEACDLSEEGDVVRLISSARTRMGGIDVLVANAGIVGTPSPLSEMPTADWDELMATNLRGTFIACREASAAMRADGIAGRIVIVGSATAFHAESDSGHYNTAKAGLLGLTRSLAVDLARWGIRVNCVAPGLTETDQTREYIKAGIHPAALGRAGQAREIAAAICFLAGDSCGFVTGSTLVVDGGEIVKGPEAPQ